MAYATAEELTGPVGYLNQVDTADEDVLTLVESILTRATEIVDGYLRFSYEAFTDQTVKSIRAGYGPYLTVPAHEQGTISLVETVGGTDLDGNWEELESGSLYAVDDSGFEGNWNAGRYNVTANWGYGPVTSDVKQVVLELGVNIWRSKDSGRFTNVIGASDGGAVGYEGALTPHQRMILDNVKKKYFKVVI